VNLDVIPKRADLLQKMFCRNFDQIPTVAAPQRPLAIDYVPTFFLFGDFFHTRRGAEIFLEKLDSKNTVAKNRRDLEVSRLSTEGVVEELLCERLDDRMVALGGIHDDAQKLRSARIELHNRRRRQQPDVFVRVFEPRLDLRDRCRCQWAEISQVKDGRSHDHPVFVLKPSDQLGNGHVRAWSCSGEQLYGLTPHIGMSVFKTLDQSGNQVVAKPFQLFKGITGADPLMLFIQPNESAKFVTDRGHVVLRSAIGVSGRHQPSPHR